MLCRELKRKKEEKKRKHKDELAEEDEEEIRIIVRRDKSSEKVLLQLASFILTTKEHLYKTLSVLVTTLLSWWGHCRHANLNVGSWLIDLESGIDNFTLFCIIQFRTCVIFRIAREWWVKYRRWHVKKKKKWLRNLERKGGGVFSFKKS